MKSVTKRQEVIAGQAVNPIYYSIDFPANIDTFGTAFVCHLLFELGFDLRRK